MKTSSKLLLGSAFCIALIAIVALVTLQLVKQSNHAVREEDNWFVCTRVNMDVISDAVASFARTNNAVVTLETLVKAGKLPEWSEVYICPSWFDVCLPKRNYDDAFRSNLALPSSIAARYSKCSYYVESLPDKFRVRCLYHTNVMNYVVSRQQQQ